jgi:hypothetical protein
MATEKKVEGFGDEIARVTKKLGLDQVAEQVAKAAGKEDCGCKKRQKQLNNPDLLVNKIFYGKNKIKENEK